MFDPVKKVRFKNLKLVKLDNIALTPQKAITWMPAMVDPL